MYTFPDYNTIGCALYNYINGIYIQCIASGCIAISVGSKRLLARSRDTSSVPCERANEMVAGS